MRNIFIINPMAGPKDSSLPLVELLEGKGAEHNIEIYYTKHAFDATEYVRSVCEASNEPVRFYACGGDGTLNEVVNGAACHAHAAVGCYPCGSGNDFVKCFDDKEKFLDIDRQLRGEAMPIDIIDVNGKYSVNVCNFGLDAAVAETMQRVKNKFIFRGKMAYFAGVLKAFVKNVRTKCSVITDSEELSEGDILLCTIANGQYVGGSFRCAPRAVLDDGLLEVCVVKPIPRVKFLGLMGPYSRGEHLDKPGFEKIMSYKRGKQIKVSSPESGFLYTLDGELVFEKEFTASVVPGGVNFILPEGARPV